MEVVLLGETSKEYMEKQAKIVASAAKLSRFDGSILDVYEKLTNNYDNNIKFIKRVIKMGHDSITDHDFIVLALKDISVLAEQTIIEQRFCSFTVKSRREVDFSKAGYFIPNFYDENNQLLENNEDLQTIYKVQMNYLFAEYGRLVEMGVPVEDARYILPYSFHSNLIMGLDAHSLKDLIIDLTKGKHSNISELKELGLKLYDVMENRCEYLKDVIDNDKKENNDVVLDYLNEILLDRKKDLLENNDLENPILLSKPKNIDETLFVSAIMRVYGYSYDKSLELYQTYLNGSDKYQKEIKEKLIRLINVNKEELKNINFSFQIPISLANLTHLTRHRTIELLIPDFVPIRDLSKYKVPNTILESGYDIKDLLNQNIAIYNSLKKAGVRDEDLVYLYLSGTIFQVIANMNGKTLEHVLKLRCCNKAQWEIRSIANEMRNLVTDESIFFSKILGPSCEVDFTCHEGRECCGKIKKLLPKNTKTDI